MFKHGSSRTPVREAILHCAAINTGQFSHMRAFQVFATINRWHTERGFTNGFGYHGLIMPDGAYYPGRPYSMVGAHCAGRNTGTLGFLLIESRKIDRIGVFEDWFTEAQRRSLCNVLKGVPGLLRVSGHNDHAARLCPGFKVKSDDWL